MRAKKSLGQHFLHDDGVLQAITRALEWRDDEQIIEIGPGTGQLSRVLAELAGHDLLTCVEKDRAMIAHLARKQKSLKVVEGDAMRFDFTTLLGDEPAVVAGNLPYNVGTEIYFHLLENHRGRFRRLVLMFQKEVADRLVASEGSKKYGPPSVMTRVLADARSIMTVKPESFRPPPRVDSSVIVVDPLPEPRFGLSDTDLVPFGRFVRGIFGQRRKTIHNNMKRVVGPQGPDALAAAGIDPQARPETLAPEALVKLWRAVLPVAT
ncbi:MAG: 16S rRNA (adenine1518-N6/adenine1519-N6)-dimethyltransferase [Myxococcota bacterium]|jgi:16S rRNA (adenine1518-N6/adenine1519-N6)-dimethyltransferase